MRLGGRHAPLKTTTCETSPHVMVKNKQNEKVLVCFKREYDWIKEIRGTSALILRWFKIPTVSCKRQH
jgi:hypothetical protein